MQQAEFHRKYESYPEDTKFELIAGTVYMASPLRSPHGTFSVLLAWLFESYSVETPGVQALHDATIILDMENEPQPDLTLRVLPKFGGNTTDTKEGYVKGAPELICEIAHSSRAIDMHQKKDAYRRSGVGEYLVLAIGEGEVAWFDFRSKRAISPNSDGISKSRIFPGLWLMIPALIAQRRSDLTATLRSGLQSPEHAAFVKRLEARRAH
jgi:Uma2 family endonuclease